MPISVFLVDNHEVVRRGLRTLLNAEPDITVVGEAGTASEALVAIPRARPDVAVLDIRLPDGEGVMVCREIRSQLDPPPACLMLTSYSDDRALFGAIMAGANGYILKQVTGTNLVSAVRTIAAGESLLDARITSIVLNRLRGNAQSVDSRYEQLSEREKKVLDLIGEGLTNRQIASTLFLAEKTVKNYVSALLHKLDLERRTEAAVYAARMRRHDPGLR